VAVVAQLVVFQAVQVVEVPPEAQILVVPARQVKVLLVARVTEEALAVAAVPAAEEVDLAEELVYHQQLLVVQ
jgi:hypothetical protein